MKIAESISQLIGNTPLLKLNNFMKSENLTANVLAKLECFNPLSSVKDRVGYALIRDGEKRGIIKSGTVIIEPTSGNTGIGLAFVCASRGYRLILTMPESMSIERRSLVSALNAEVVLTPAALGMKGAIEKAESLNKEIVGSCILGQFTNSANPQIHKQTTAMEIWEDTEHKVDIFVAGVGTGGTITGVGEFLKEQNSSIRIIAVEPYDSPVLSKGKTGAHKLQGIGAGFVPEILNRGIIDEIITVKNEQAVETCRRLAKTEGVLAGFSGGAALFAAAELAKLRENKDKNIVVLLPDTGERYLSTALFNDQ